MELYSWKNQCMHLYKDGVGYMKTLERHLTKPSRFDNKLLFNMAVMSYEKLFAALLAHYEMEALHHTPVAMYKETQEMDKNLPPEMLETAKLIQSFESICTFDGKGYTTPSDKELFQIIQGLMHIRDYIASTIDLNGNAV